MARLIIYFDYWHGVCVNRNGRIKQLSGVWDIKDLCRLRCKRASFYPGGVAYEVY